MAYIPKLKYVFVEPRVHQMEWHLPIFRYMNNLGMIPRVLAGGLDVIENLEDNSISFENLTDLPEDYDIMLSLAATFLPFARYWLERSMKKAKIKDYVVQPPMPFCCAMEGVNTMATKFLHAMCAADQITIDNVKRFNKEVLYLKTGYTVWDEFSSDEFKNKVADIKKRYGEKLLVVTIDVTKAEEFLYSKKAISLAKSLGFEVVLQVHPGHRINVPDQFAGYVNPGLNRFALFAAASHVIASIRSTVVSECLYIGSKVGCKPYGVKGGDWMQWTWFQNIEQWYQSILPYYKKEYLDLVPLIHDKKTMTEFLTSNIAFEQDEINHVFGWPEVDNFCENTFRTIESYFGPHNSENVQKILKKSEAVRDMVAFFGWERTRAGTFVEHINDPTILTNNGIGFLKQGNIGAAVTCLRIAEQFSGITDSFDFIQYALATCYNSINHIEKAQKHIYRALLIKPDCQEYRNLKDKIDAKAGQ